MVSFPERKSNVRFFLNRLWRERSPVRIRSEVQLGAVCGVSARAVAISLSIARRASSAAVPS
jgi:hypothetical protein